MKLRCYNINLRNCETEFCVRQQAPPSRLETPTHICSSVFESLFLICLRSFGSGHLPLSPHSSSQKVKKTITAGSMSIQLSIITAHVLVKLNKLSIIQSLFICIVMWNICFLDNKVLVTSYYTVWIEDFHIKAL